MKVKGGGIPEERKHLADARRVVVKVGTRLLVSDNGRPSERRMRSLVEDIARIRNSGREVVLVSSGAIACGLEVLGRKTRPRAICDLQMSAAVGQSRLMAYYNKLFSEVRLKIGQVLLTHDDLNSRTRHLNARNTMLSILRNGIVPIVNENDAISADEIKVGDNDLLAALVSLLVGADVLVLLTSVNGLRQPIAGGKTRRVAHLESVTRKYSSLASGKGSRLSVGGMSTKLEAAQMFVKAGGLVVIADGRRSGILETVFNGEDVGTLVGTLKHDGGSLKKHRKRWLAFFQRAAGSFVIDDGAVRAIKERGHSLLPIGIVAVRGSFEVGALVNVTALDGRLVARGLVEYSSEQVEAICKHKSSEIEALLGSTGPDEVIHRDNMVLMENQDEEVL